VPDPVGRIGVGMGVQLGLDGFWAQIFNPRMTLQSSITPIFNQSPNLPSSNLQFPPSG
jgi:hypothetical protein